MESGLCSAYITKLISIGIVKKEYPFREETSERTIYSLGDGMFRFWYRFVPGNMATYWAAARPVDGIRSLNCYNRICEADD